MSDNFHHQKRLYAVLVTVTHDTSRTLISSKAINRTADSFADMYAFSICFGDFTPFIWRSLGTAAPRSLYHRHHTHHLQPSYTAVQTAHLHCTFFYSHVVLPDTANASSFDAMLYSRLVSDTLALSHPVAALTSHLNTAVSTIATVLPVFDPLSPTGWLSGSRCFIVIKSGDDGYSIGNSRLLQLLIEIHRAD